MLKMTPELDKIFASCSEKSLGPKESALVALAAHLASEGSAPSPTIGQVARSTASPEEVQRVACMCACTVGPRAQTKFSRLESPQLGGALGTAVAPANLDESVFRNFRLCRAETLDKKTHHLVGLAACLAAGCVCAAGHIVEARNAGASDEELARCACIAACSVGLKAKYNYLEAHEASLGCRACAC